MRDAAASAADDPIAGLIHSGQYREAVRRSTEEHGAAIGRLAMALLRCQAEAEDVVQETLVAAYHAMPSYRGEASVRAWLCGIARRLCAKRLEKKSRRQRLWQAETQAGETVGLAQPNPDRVCPEEALERQARLQALYAALAQLKPSEREAVLLRYSADMSYRDIAASCGIAEAAARKRTSRALVQLRALLRPEVTP